MNKYVALLHMQNQLAATEIHSLRNHLASGDTVAAEHTVHELMSVGSLGLTAMFAAAKSPTICCANPCLMLRKRMNDWPNWRRRSLIWRPCYAADSCGGCRDSRCLLLSFSARAFCKI